jgi:hypothetical protein
MVPRHRGIGGHRPRRPFALVAPGRRRPSVRPMSFRRLAVQQHPRAAERRQLPTGPRTQHRTGIIADTPASQALDPSCRTSGPVPVKHGVKARGPAPALLLTKAST